MIESKKHAASTIVCHNIHSYLTCACLSFCLNLLVWSEASFSDFFFQNFCKHFLLFIFKVAWEASNLNSAIKRSTFVSVGAR